MSATAFRALQAGSTTRSFGVVEDSSDASVKKTWSQIDRAVREIREAQFTETLLRQLGEAGFYSQRADAPTSTSTTSTSSPNACDAELRFQQMVILGLGSPSNSLVSRFQLALAMVLSEWLGVRHESVLLYDPVFTPIDVATLSEKKIGKTLDRTKADVLCGESAARTKVNTFWFMPHCEAVLYNNVLRANVGVDNSGDSSGDSSGDAKRTEALSSKKVTHVFLGNKFCTYDLRWVGRRGDPECPLFVLDAAAAVAESGIEIEVDPNGTFLAAAAVGAFNDTSVQRAVGRKKV